MKLHYSEMMNFHAERAIKYLNFEPYNEKDDRKSAAMFWLYSPDDYKALYHHEGRSYIFWHGVDVLYLHNHKKNFLPIIRNTNSVCACHNEVQQNFLAEMGIFAHVRPVFWNDTNKYAPVDNTFTKQVYITSHPGREAEYGEPMINAVACSLSDWSFHIFGTKKTQTVHDNVFYHGQVSEQEMDKITENHAATIRWKHINGRHWDGVSQTVIKALLRDQMAITGIKYSFAHYAKNILDIINYLQHIEKYRDTLAKIEINNFDWLEETIMS